MYTTLKEVLKEAEDLNMAIGAFNTHNLEMLPSIIKAAVNQRTPVIIQTSCGTANYIGHKNLVSVCKSMAEQYGIDVVLHLDHAKDYDEIRKAIDAGYSSVMFDGSSLPLKDNILGTRRVVEYAKKNGIELSDDQKAKVDEAIEKLQTESEDYLDAVGATDELIEKTYTENAIANLVYMDLVADVDTTVGDDEFLRKKIAYVKLTPSELTETTAADEATTEVSSDEDSSEEASSIENTEAESESASKDVTTSTEEASSEKASTEAVSTEEASSENVSELSSEASTEDSTEVETLSEEEQERQDAMNDAADKILKEFEEGNDAADFISDYQNDSHFTATNSEISISEDGTAVYNAAAWALSTDECTVYKSDDGSIYIIRCLDDNDEEARQSAIDSEIESRKTALFSEKYAEIQEESSKFKVDEDVIDTIRFTTPVYVAPSEEESSEGETSGEETSENETSEEESSKAEKSSESDETEEAVSEASSEEESK